MILTNLTTILGNMTTNAKVSREALQNLLLDGAKKSFNRITIDGDTSTDDCCMLIASDKATLPETTEAGGPLFITLKPAVFEVCICIFASYRARRRRRD